MVKLDRNSFVVFNGLWGQTVGRLSRLRRGQGMAAFWQDRYDGWLSQMEGLYLGSLRDG